MGSVVGKAMDENMKKQQEFMVKQQVTVMERQIQMQNQMRERQQAMMIARSRDLTIWLGSFLGLYTTMAVIGVGKTGNKGLIAPLLPLTFIFGYWYDMAYHTKMKRMREIADRILDEETDLLLLPHSLPSFASIESARLKQKSDDVVRQGHDLFL